MTGLGTRLYNSRKVLGLSQADLARKVGISQQAIDRIENGITQNPRKIVFLAQALSVSPDWLATGNINSTLSHPTSTGNASAAPAFFDKAGMSVKASYPFGSIKDRAFCDKETSFKHQKYPKKTPDIFNAYNTNLPILGRAQGGPEGNMVLDQGAIDWTWRPASLDHVEDAFAIFVTGSSMEPRYFSGDIVYVHPKKAIRRGRHVLIETTCHNGFIKRFEKWTDDNLVLHQYNPDKEMILPRSDVLRVMLVVGCMENC